MKTDFRIISLLLIAVLTGGPALTGSRLLCAQTTGYFDDFEDGVADTLWVGNAVTFGLSEADGSLSIAYNRSAESTNWDNFNFTPPDSIDVSGNPVIIFRLRSDVATVFTAKPVYSNGNTGWKQHNVPADGAWNTYTFDLVENEYLGGKLVKIYFYLDGGSTEIKSGTVDIDEFQVAGLSVNITNLEASLVDSVTVRLCWDSNDPDHVQNFNVYRGDSINFTAGPESLLGQPVDTFLVDTGLGEHTSYYYKVSATDTEGREHAPAEVNIRTATPGSPPLPFILGENASPVGTYQKYELEVGMDDADFDNPYDPDEIDLWAIFSGPGGESISINGFYDNFEGADSWKIRFAAPAAGSWTCQVFARDLDGEGSSEAHNFEVVESGNRGHIHVSSSNPDYLAYDDQGTFYGVAVYYPWWVSETGLDAMKAAGCNMFGYWDCTFDGAGNGGGSYLLESMASGVGRYDQRKAARIDQLLEWSETRDLKIMLALWAHPYIRISGEPWDDGRWFASNPYSQVFDIDDFYTDSLARAYQAKHHRYAIARFGYSTSLGIWEIINEMHGTTGWVRDQAGAKAWVEEVHRYFKENDPYARPTTASFGGAGAASHYYEGDQLGDIANVHFYEQHGWTNPYPDNLVRGGLANVVKETVKLKSSGRRPAFMGEAGYTSMLADVATEEYTWELHNALWAGLTNGFATTPFWWDYTSTDDVLTDERMARYAIFSQFAADLDFPLPMDQGKVSVEGTDASFRSGPDNGVGWGRTYGDTAISNANLVISGSSLANGTHDLSWFDTWTGQSAGNDMVCSVEGITWTRVPASVENQDVAFRTARRLDGWQSATQLNLQLVKIDTVIPVFPPFSPGKDSVLYKIVCYVTDHQGMLDADFNGTVDVTWEGSAHPGSSTVQLNQGGKVLEYIRSGESGATVTVTIDGLGSASLDIPGIVGTAPSKPAGMQGNTLSPVLPNPVTGPCTLEYILSRAQQIRLAVYDAHGRLVEVLDEGQRGTGRHNISWEADQLKGGFYLLTLEGRDFRCVQKFVR